MRVRDIMRRDVQWCSPRTTLEAAGRTMAGAGCGFLPVVAEGRVVGVLTDRDACVALARLDRRPSQVEVQAAMSRQVHGCAVDEDVPAALRKMRDRGVRRLPVLDAGGRLQGVLSLDDVALAARAFEGEGFSGPLYPDVAATLQAICVAQAAPAAVAH
jgi:CBS domain-containing protein